MMKAEEPFHHRTLLSLFCSLSSILWHCGMSTLECLGLPGLPKSNYCYLDKKNQSFVGSISSAIVDTLLSQISQVNSFSKEIA